jgi:ubiquinone/menaquinone biosynthesis C-methylase UbiE
MDAACLQFRDHTFDCVFSYNAFEHFARPDKVLAECIRAVRPGGVIYHDFGPLYMAPLGLHAYRSVRVPYCQFLFSRETLEKFCHVKGLDPIEFDDVNGWSIEQYRALWSNHADQVRTLLYEESLDLSGLELIHKYPSCFRSKTDCFDNLFVSHLRVLFQKCN